MRDLHVVQDGALLIQDGVVRETGTARRIENLAEARNAREIDAGGRIVMPAFVDPDTVLVTPGSDTPRRTGEASIATASKRRLEGQTSLSVNDWVRHGVLAMGASTYGAGDLRAARKLLTVQQAFQGKPLRIRSVFAPHACDDWERVPAAETVEAWTAAIVHRRLAGVLELEIPVTGSSSRNAALAAFSRLAVPQGFVLRLRSEGPLTSAGQRLVEETGAVAVIAPGISGEPVPEFARASCVLVLAAAGIMSGEGPGVGAARGLIDAGLSVGLGSGYRNAGAGSFNPQYVLHLACEKLGMTIEEALTAATWNAACSLRMATVAGSLEPGKQADLLVMDVGDYRDLPRRAGHNDVDMVLRAGRLVYRRGGLIPG